MPMYHCSAPEGLLDEAKRKRLVSAQMWSSETGVDIKDVLVSISESAAGNIMEFGEILPDPSDEKEWLERHGFTARPRSRLTRQRSRPTRQRTAANLIS